VSNVLIPTNPPLVQSPASSISSTASIASFDSDDGERTIQVVDINKPLPWKFSGNLDVWFDSAAPAPVVVARTEWESFQLSPHSGFLQAKFYSLSVHGSNTFGFYFPTRLDTFGSDYRTRDRKQQLVIGCRNPHAYSTTADIRIEKPDRWTKYKWVLLVLILIGFWYSSVGLGRGFSRGSEVNECVSQPCRYVNLRTGWGHTEAMYTADADILVFITVAGSIQIFTPLVGLYGIVLNSRAILAVYCLLLWPSFVSLVVVGYSSYK
jgi:hypothetical protein